MTWLIAIARNRAIDRLRATRPNRRIAPLEAADNVADAAPTADRALEAESEESSRLHGCLDGGEKRERAALRAAFFNGDPYEELAARMHLQLGTMKSWIRRAMIKLKACLEQ